MPAGIFNDQYRTTSSENMKHTRNTSQRPFFVCFLLFVLFVGPLPAFSAAAQQETPDLPTPKIVAIAGDFQSELGCSGDWNTDCDVTFLQYDAGSDLWRAKFTLPAGEWEYKAALNGTWEDNFGLNAEYYGPNIPLKLDEEQSVTFFYDHNTHWVTDNVNSIVANVPGSFQDAVGCAGDWAPDCLRTRLQDPDGDGIYTYITTYIPAGDYEAKVAVNESWDENYGADGIAGGGNIPFTVPDKAQVTFTWDPASKLLTITTAAAPEGALTSPPVVATAPVNINPDYVTIPGTIQSVLGCSGDWQPDCGNTFLTLDEEDDVWQGAWELPAGNYEYKVAIDQSWSVNYGLNAQKDGPNIPLTVPEGGAVVKFYYDNKTKWVTDNVNSRIPTVFGSFQDELGCAADDDPSCLRAWLEDPDGNGVYAATVPAFALATTGETYTARVALNETADEIYGVDGAPGGDPLTFTVPPDAAEIFFEYNAETHVLTINTAGAPKGDLGLAQAHWVTRDTIAWDIDPAAATTFTLHYAVNGGLTLKADGDFGGETIPLTVDAAGLSDDIIARFPQLRTFTALKIGPDALRQVRIALKGQFVVSAQDAEGTVVDATGLQIPGVLDDLYTYDGPLGATIADGAPTLRLWAPTARAVRLLLYPDAAANTRPQPQTMRVDPDTGVWTAAGAPDWMGQYYLYEVQVYVPFTGKVETNLVTDPYSISLAMNSTRSQIVDLNDPALMPADWTTLAKPDLAAPEDIVLYELHVRDFSVNDPSVPADLRGTYLAFTLPDSNGMKHLQNLAAAGLTHIHLLPVFDIATINEDKSTWEQVDFGELAALPPDSEEQQALLAPTRGKDGFNWGYDPYHYSTPEGSYSTDPNGPARILEFRQMVEALNKTGLRVVMDVVYNHTNASGQSERSVLDRIVPGYYHRLDGKGRVANSTCCANTATEHNMMHKLMVDSVVMWATVYKIDGFRFDLMGHHMRDDMLAVQSALRALTTDADGVDGAQIYVYGEGWNFGEVADNARGVNATQLNMAGTGIGTFNDRVRDAARGGSPFGGYQEQGFIDGLYTNPNEVEARPEGVQKVQLLHFADQIRVALAGNLADYSFVDMTGETVTGAEVDYNGSPAGYTQDPQEQIVYISAHDNETLFDAVQYKAPATATTADRARMQQMGLSLVALSQGVPFFHAGSDMLRSKSFDRDSYDSGDWFNRLDFTYQDAGFGSGLPPADKNKENWPIMQPLLANTDLRPTSADILSTEAHFQEMLRVRQSSPLFRLQTAADVQQRLTFQNTGPDQIPGLIVMTLSDVGGALDPQYDAIVVLFNATNVAQDYVDAEMAGATFALHPVQAASADSLVRTAGFDSGTGTFSVPALTTAVFVAEKGTMLAARPAPTPEPQPTPPAPEATPPAPEAPGADSQPSPGVIWGIAAAAVAILGGAVLFLIRRR